MRPKSIEVDGVFAAVDDDGTARVTLQWGDHYRLLRRGWAVVQETTIHDHRTGRHHMVTVRKGDR